MKAPELTRLLDITLIRQCIVRALIPAAIFYVLTIALMMGVGFEISEIIRDAAQVTDQSSFLGFVSNIGVWLWVAAATLGLFAGLMYRSQAPSSLRQLLLLCGLLSLLLALDDFFMLHDNYLEQEVFYALYAVLLLAILARHNRDILQVDPVAFVVAGSLLALSIMTDITQNSLPLGYWITQVSEEAFKFGGIATWLYFTVKAVSHYLQPMAQHDP